jgi:TRAP-type C4-dicarboxylate transport system substrate-binding protein
VLHGGTEGSEAKMHLSLASNTIQAAVFTSFGLNAIDPIMMTMSAPFLIRTEAELTEVMKEVQGELEVKLNKGDYFIVAWSKAGFVNIFSKEPVNTPDDLKRQRIASNAEAEDMNTAFKTMGFQVIESDWSDVGPKLATGAVMAAYQQPAAIAAFQLHTQLKNMLSINVAPVLGGIVVNQVTWRRIGAMNPRYQQELMRVTRQIADELDKSMQRTVSEAVAAMKREGLKENVPTAAQAQLWYNEVDRVVPALVGTTFDRDLYNKITTILTRFRGRR